MTDLRGARSGAMTGMALRWAIAALLGAVLLAPAAASAAPPANDDFANPALLEGEAPEAAGTTVGATAEAGEPNRGGEAQGTSVWYRWVPAHSGLVRVSCESGFETIVSVYTGSSLAGLAEVGSDRAGEECGTPDLYFRASAGADYRIEVDGAVGGGAGPFVLELVNTSNPPANDDFAAAEELQTHVGMGTSGTTAGASRESGEPPHGGSATGSSVWYSWVAPRSGLTRIYPCDASYHPTIDVYTGVSLGALSLVSTPGDISGELPWCGLGGLGGASFTAVAGAKYWIAVDGRSGEWGYFRLELREPALMTPPETTLRGGVYIHKRVASFEFEGRGTPASPPPPPLVPSAPVTLRFLCRLDRHPFVECTSPKRYGKLSTGFHRFEVKAVDEAGNEDPTPVARRFRILRPGSKR